MTVTSEKENKLKDGAPNPYLRGIIYNKEKSDKDFAEIRGVPIEETQAEYDALWKQVDDLRSKPEGLLYPNR